MNTNKYIPPFNYDFYGKEFSHNQNIDQRFIQGDGKTFIECRPPQARNLNSEQFVTFHANSYPNNGFGLSFPQNQQVADCLVQSNHQSLGEQGNSYAINLAHGQYTSGAGNYFATNVNGINFNCQQQVQERNIVQDGTLPVFPDNRNSRLSKKEKKNRKINTADRPFPCDECGKAFASRDGLRSHLICHSQEKRFECDFCGKKFLRKQSMQHHRLIHTGERPFVCEVCQKDFPVRRRLKIHMRAHSNDRPYTCDVCDKKFKSMDDVKMHKKFHSEEKPHACQLCPMRFKRTYHLTLHQRVHTGVKPFHCKMCPMQYSKRESFNKHVQSHGGQTLPDLNLDNKPIGKNPKKMFEAITRKPHLCLICREEFPDQHKLEEHRLYHKREKPFPCFVCGARFFRSPNLKVHLSVIHSEGSTQMDSKDKICNQMNSKEKTFMFKKKHFTCQICSKIFLFKIHLQNHFKGHLRERGLPSRQGEFACNKCGKRFPKKSNLRIHSFLHSKRKEYHECTVCAKKFIGKSLLRRHMLNVHRTNTEESCICPVCQNDYLERSTVIRHCRKHHPEYDLKNFQRNSTKIQENSQVLEVSSDKSDEENISLEQLQKKIFKGNYKYPVNKDIQYQC